MWIIARQKRHCQLSVAQTIVRPSVTFSQSSDHAPMNVMRWTSGALSENVRAADITWKRRLRHSALCQERIHLVWRNARHLRHGGICQLLKFVCIGHVVLSKNQYVSWVDLPQNTR